MPHFTELLRQTPIALGCEPLGGADWGTVDERQAMAAVRAAYEKGVRVFDTADVYGLGLSERRLSEALGADRYGATIVTKFGVRWVRTHPTARALTFRDASPAYALEALDSSLGRLRLDTIPVYLLHWPDSQTPIEHTLEALMKAQELGKIRHIGLSNFDEETVRRATAVAPIAFGQVHFSLLRAGPALPLLRTCAELGIFTLTYGTLAQGLLTGKYGSETRFPASDRRHRLPHFSPANIAKYQALIARLCEFAATYGVTTAAVAIRWVLQTGLVSVAVVGARDPGQVEGNLGAARFSLSGPDHAELSRLAASVAQTPGGIPSATCRDYPDLMLRYVTDAEQQGAHLPHSELDDPT
ncbi:MAG: aldo/keto reductase [Armatimonadetes bacterium]|nr:aldo/keto reductase [Armatimonadota bacterium]